MEMLAMNEFSGIYGGRRVLLTGHTGFKGSWLALWLHNLGANVAGLALSPEAKPNHWDLLKLPISNYSVDIRNLAAVEDVFSMVQPEIVFHLAAQPLVRRSYADPIHTWSTNVMGTVNILEACRKTPAVRAIVVATTDKCYENREWIWGYREIDPLGGHDPYSASKAGAELVAASYRRAYFGLDTSPLLATGRAGNVIGGGDWSDDRLIPDLVRAISQREALEIRSPSATRPWQHVLDSLSGYLLLGQSLFVGEKIFADAWNFGPEPEGNRNVSEVLEKFKTIWPAACWDITELPQPHEASMLYLDSTRARKVLGWQPIWNFDLALTNTVKWYRDWLENGELHSHAQLNEYINAARELNASWTK